MASSASRIGLLLTSSSRARSLILTLLIRPLSLPVDAHPESVQLVIAASFNGELLLTIIAEKCEIAASSCGTRSGSRTVGSATVVPVGIDAFVRDLLALIHQRVHGIVVAFDHLFAAVGV